MSLCLFLFLSLFILSGHYGPLAVLLATLLHTLRVSAFNVTDASSATAIQRTYELTKYLEHQLSTLTVSYLTYLGPPFNDPDFTPPRPNNSASLPSAATRLDLWKGLDNRLRLSENHRAYSILLGALKGLAAGTLCPSLQRSLQHFCTGLHGLLVSIAGVMTSLGYPPPLPSGEDIPNFFTPRPGGLYRGGGHPSGFGRAFLTTPSLALADFHSRDSPFLNEKPVRFSERDARYLSLGAGVSQRDYPREYFPGKFLSRIPVTTGSAPPVEKPPTRNLTQFEGSSSPARRRQTLWGEGNGPYASYLVPETHTLSDFSRKMGGFWVLKELQTWLWRSAKDFNRLKKKLPIPRRRS
ncbi:CLCF1 factor, partial [Polypterus senegalus]|nr:CLCF1 factor [Polypterus senegalus]